MAGFTDRKGITPIIAIVILMLLVILLASAAHVLFSGFLSGSMDDVEEQLRTGMDVVDLNCVVDTSEGDIIEMGIQNRGEPNINADSVDTFINDMEGSLHGMVVDEDWSDKAFMSPQGFDRVTVHLEDAESPTAFTENHRYAIAVEFGSIRIDAGTCRALDVETVYGPLEIHISDDDQWYSSGFKKSVEENGGEHEITDCEYQISDGGDLSGWENRDCNGDIEISVGSEADDDCTVEGEQACGVEVRATLEDGTVLEDDAAYNIDYTPPETDIQSPDAGEEQDSDFPVTVTDDDHGLSPITCAYRVRDGTENEGVWSGWQFRECEDDFEVSVGWSSINDCTTPGEDVCGVEVRARDEASHEVTDTAVYDIDLPSSPPTVTDDYEQEGWQTEPQPVTITCEGEDVGCEDVEWEIQDEDEVLRNGTESGTDPVEVDLTVGDEEEEEYGSLTLRYRGTNEEGTSSEWAETDLLISLNPPHVHIEDDDSWYSDEFTAVVDEDWSEPPQDHCMYRTNDSTAGWSEWKDRDCGEVTVSVGAEPEHDCTGEGEQACAVQVFVNDTSGQNDTDTARFNIDYTPPTTEIQGPSADQTQDSEFTVLISDSDNQELDYCEYQIKDGDAEWTDEEIRDCDGTVEISVGDGGDCTTHGDDTCNVTVRATDAAGLQDVDHRAWSIDMGEEDEALDTVITGPETAHTYGDTFTVAVNDSGGENLDTCEYQIDGNGWIERSCPNGLFDVSTSDCTGTCTVETQVEDGDGNTATDSRTYTIDPDMPVIVFEENEIIQFPETDATVEWGVDHTYREESIYLYPRTLGIGNRLNLSVHGTNDETVETTIDTHGFTTFAYGSSILEIHTTASNGVDIEFTFTGSTTLGSGEYVLYRNGAEHQTLGTGGTLSWQDTADGTTQTYTIIPEQ